jgi:hypothetical protein
VPLQIFGAFIRRFFHQFNRSSNVLRRFSITLGPMCLTACSVFGYEHHTPVGHVEAFPKDDADTIEIRMPYKVTGRGNVHNPFSHEKWEYISSDWVVIGKRIGESVLDGRRLMPCPDGYNMYYSGMPVKGTVNIQGDVIQINLSVPSQGKPGWTDYELNGTWPLSVKTVPPMKAIESPAAHDCKPGHL